MLACLVLLFVIAELHALVVVYCCLVGLWDIGVSVTLVGLGFGRFVCVVGSCLGFGMLVWVVDLALRGWGCHMGCWLCGSCAAPIGLRGLSVIACVLCGLCLFVVAGLFMLVVWG